MKKKISLFVSLALAGFLTAGCSIQDIFKKKQQTPSEQKEEEQHEQETPEVVKVQSVVLQENQITLDVGEKYQILASVLPENATNKNLKYRSSNSHACSVSVTGLITAYEPGTATIKVSSEENAEIFANFAVTVNEEGEVPPTNYTVSFNANGGSGTMANQTTSGKTFVVPDCDFTYANHTFTKWALGSATGTQYAPTQTITNINSNIELFALWKDDSQGGGSEDDYYDSLVATSGQALLGELHDLSVTKHTKYNAYNENSTTNYLKTDRYENSEYLMDFYSGAPTKNQVYSSGTVGWNREHVWCQNLSNGLYGTSGAGADIQHIRPTIPKLNSDRDNKKYGELNNSGTLSSATDANGQTAKGGYYSGDVFQPMSDKKGDAARIVMYLYMHYNKAANIGGTKDGSNSSYFGTLHFADVMVGNETAAIQLLLTWNAADPVDEIEMTRNVEAAKITGCRNPFIDHPEYANAIWGN